MPSLILLVGVIALAASIIIVAVWVFKLNGRMSDLTRMLMLEQRRTQEIARRIGIKVPRQNGRERSLRGEGDPRPANDRQKEGQPRTRLSQREPDSLASRYRGKTGELPPQQKQARAYPQAVSTQQAFVYDTQPYDAETYEVPLYNAQDYTTMIVDPAAGQIERQPRPRMGAAMSNPQPQGRRPSPQAQRATSAMRASFESASDAIRAQAYAEAYASGSWLESQESRFENRKARQQNAMRRREERQQAQLRRQAEEIVQNHMRQIEEARDYQQAVPEIPEMRREIYGDYGIPNANDMRY